MLFRSGGPAYHPKFFPFFVELQKNKIGKIVIGFIEIIIFKQQKNNKTRNFRESFDAIENVCRFICAMMHDDAKTKQTDIVLLGKMPGRYKYLNNDMNKIA